MKRQHVVDGEAFGAPVPGRWPGGSPEPADGVRVRRPERRRPAWKIVYFVFMAALLLLGVAIVVGFALWFLADSNAPLF